MEPGVEKTSLSRQGPSSVLPSSSPRGQNPLRQRRGPGSVLHLAFCGESAGTFSGTSPWGCQHSGIRKGKVRPRSQYQATEAFLAKSFLWPPWRPKWVGRRGVFNDNNFT